MTLGPAVFKSVMEVLGLPYGTDEIPAGLGAFVPQYARREDD